MYSKRFAHSFSVVKHSPLGKNLFGLFGSQKPSESPQQIRKVYLFGGQGTHEKGMLSQYQTHQRSKQILNLISEQSQQLNLDLLEIGTTDRNNLINQTEFTQPLLVLYHFLKFNEQNNLGPFQNNSKNSSQVPQNSIMIGHSLGEYSALLLSGSLSLTECLKLVHTRGSLMTKHTANQKRGSLIVRYNKSQNQETVFELIKENQCEIGCFNSPSEIVVSGTLQNNNKLKQQLKQKLKVSAMLLPVSTAFHCKALQPMENQFRMALQHVNFKTPKYQVIRNIDEQIYSDRSSIIEGLLRQNTQPVRFYQSVKNLIKRQQREAVQRERTHRFHFVEISGSTQHLMRWVTAIQKEHQQQKKCQ